MDIKAKLLCLIELASGPIPGADCWLFRWATNNSGDCYIAYKGWPEGVHRISWIVNRGPIPNGIYVCHHCDTPNCFRPEHLFLGTPQENVWDMISKGRDRFSRLRRKRSWRRI